VLHPKHWPGEIKNHLTFGETEIINLSTRLRLNDERDDTEFPRIPGGEKNSGQMI
jgi:hypothetical protein